MSLHLHEHTSICKCKDATNQQYSNRIKNYLGLKVNFCQWFSKPLCKRFPWNSWPVIKISKCFQLYQTCQARYTSIHECPKVQNDYMEPLKSMATYRPQLHKRKYVYQFSQERLFVKTFKSSESRLEHPWQISNNPDIRKRGVKCKIARRLHVVTLKDDNKIWDKEG